MQRPSQNAPRPQMDRAVLGRAMQYLWREKLRAGLPYIFLLIATLSQLVVPRLVRAIIDAVSKGVIADAVLGGLGQIPAAFMSQALPKILAFLSLPATWTQDQLLTKLTADKASAPNDLAIAAAAIIGFAILRGVFAFLQAYYAERNSQGVAYDLRNDLYAKIQRLSYSYHDRNQTGQLMIRATDDVEKLRLFLGQGLLQLLGAFVLMGGTLIILFTTNVQLTFVILPIVPLAMIVFMFFSRFVQPMFTKVQQRLSALNTVLQENLAGIKVVKAFTREKSEEVKFNRAADALMDQQIAVSRLMTVLFPITFLLANLGQAAIYYFGGRQIVGGSLTLGEWQEFTLYLWYLFFPIAQFGFIIAQMGQASASAVRIFEILDARSDVTDKPDARPLPPIRGQLEFKDVTFRYVGDGAPVLNKVSFEAAPGQTVALLGATGSGKTSIINLIPRFYDPNGGQITIDGIDLRDVTQDSLRAQIGTVLQETTLFSGTVRNNIAFGKPDATQEEIEAAAKAAQAHDFIVSFPQGYDTPVGERGATLSGGQKQRIAIARALLVNPRILILDDSTSSVDMTTEALIQTALQKLMQARTSFVIAQRISTVRNADQILVLDKGQIVARGKHDDLMEDSPIYAEIYRSQLVDDTAGLNSPVGEAKPEAMGSLAKWVG